MTDDPSRHHFLELAAELVAEINGAYGLYLDATAGFAENVKRISTAGAPDHQVFLMGRGAPTDPNNVLQHQTTIGIYKARNAPNGANALRLARFLVIVVYELWEGGFRGRLAEVAGLAHNDLRAPIFGDLRRIRHAILHCGGVLEAKELTGLEVLTPPTGGVCNFDSTQVETIISETKSGLDMLVLAHTGRDPGFRTIWHVE